MLALALLCSKLQAQTFNQRLNNAARNAAENAAVRQAERRTEQAVNKAIDDAFDNSNNNSNNNSSANSNANANASQPATNAPSNTGNANPAEAAAPAPTPADAVKVMEMTYAKSDFVSGDEIFFEDLLIGEKTGEFPSMWDLDRGNAEIAQINGENAIALIGYTVITPLMKEKEYLPEVFTIEFDVLAAGGNATCEMGFAPDRVFIPRLYLGKDNMRLGANWRRPDGQSGSQSEDINVSGFQWNHISISFNQRALKYYINGVRVLNIPNMAAPKEFWIWAENGNAYFKNIRVAKGAVPLYDRMLTDGKFITYGITFDVGKSTIKPESMGEINRIVTLMTENPDLKFSVEGHTDSSGNASSNQTLSEARSQAVVDKLTENGIAGDRLTSAGKGQAAPIADNTTDEGRAKNRRVEFVKI